MLAARVFHVFMQFLGSTMWCRCKSIGEELGERLLSHLPLSESLEEVALSVSSELL